LDSYGYPHISYSPGDISGLKYASWTGSTWETETVDTSFAFHISLALDSLDNPHISYLTLHYLGGTAFDIQIKYTHLNDTIWEIDTLYSYTGEEWGSISLALDSSDYPHIAYTRDGNGLLLMLNYASWNGSSWETETVDSTFSGNLSLALDSSDNPHISYVNIPYPDMLKYASWNGANWEIETVGSDNNITNHSLTLDSSDNPHISYYRYYGGNLFYAFRNGSSWEVEVVDSTAFNVGDYNSLALDSSDNPHISYCEESPLDALKYAHRNGSAWEIEIVHSAFQLGEYTSLTMDSSDKPHISYRGEYPNHPLMYASIESTGIEDDPILPSGEVLYSPYPNPFSSVTTVNFELSEPGNMRLDVYNHYGRLMETLVDGVMNTGVHSVVLDGTGMASGIYLIRLEHSSTIATIRVVLIR